MAGAPTLISRPLLPSPPWRDVFKDPALIITLVVMFQFFGLIILFSVRPNQMAMEAKGIILQTYVVAFSACWGYWIGSSSGSKQKDKTIAGEHAAAQPVALPPEPTAHVIQQP